MSFDKRFYGLYEGIVVNHDDPEKRGRVKLRVPQVTGFEEPIRVWIFARH